MLLKALLPLFVIVVAQPASAHVPALIYHCPNNHTVDVFAQDDGALYASVDGKAALNQAGVLSLPAEDDSHSDIDMVVFGSKSQPLHLIVAQSVSVSGSVTISYVNNNKELWAYKCIGDTK